MTMRPYFSCLLFVALVTLMSGVVAAFDYQGPTGPVEGRWIVKFKPGVRTEASRLAAADHGSLQRAARLVGDDEKRGAELWNQYYSFTTSERDLDGDAIAQLLGADRIEFVEPDYWLELFGLPDDSLFSQQWYLHNTGQEYQGILRRYGYSNDLLVIKSGDPGDDINIVSYYNVPPAETTGVVVAVLDSGTDLLHPELEGRHWRNVDEIPANGIDDDHNGFIDDTLGYDMSGDSLSIFDPTGDNDPSDYFGHGTHCAGIIASNADSEGVVGVVPWVQLMSVKLMPNFTTSVGAAGIVYAVNAGAQVISISWGTPFVSGVLKDALDYARLNGVFVAIAAGNTGDNSRFYPAAFDSSFTIAAGNSRGFQTDWSTYGAHIDLVAPGLDILSLRAAGTDMYWDSGEPEVRIIDTIYYLADGTSMAAPAVAGAAAFMLSFRPDLSLDEIEELLRFGADDLVDPWNVGDTLVGQDTISGWGYLNVQRSLDLMNLGGLHLVSPERNQRYTESIVIKAAPVGGYLGGWRLDYSVGARSSDYVYLASGDYLPGDSILHVFDDPDIEGFLNFRLTDRYGSITLITCIHVRQNSLNIDSPADGDTVHYSMAITGDANGPDYDSMAVYVLRETGSLSWLTSETGEYFDSLLHELTVSGSDTGLFTIYVHGYFGASTMIDSIHLRVSSAFAVGWPVSFPGLGGITPVSDDLDNNGHRELIVPTTNGLYVYDAYGNVRSGFPALPGNNVRCVPAIYDVDGDGRREIIVTDEDGIHAIQHDGSYAEGWPVECVTGSIPYGYGHPNPTITRLGMDEDSAVVILNKSGEILAYEFDGDPYFYSLEGLFASFDSRISSFFGYGGATSPFVTSYDVTGDGVNEVIATYTAPTPTSGLGIFDGRTGQPAFDLEDHLVQYIKDVHGTVLTDLNGDYLPEIVILGRDEFSVPNLWVKTMALDDMSGWPVAMPAVQGWIASYPIAADLDLDGVPEILASFFEYDIGYLYAFRADGTPFYEIDGHADGLLYSAAVTFGTPMVANLTGDEYPEIVLRSGFILPTTGSEYVHILDRFGNPLPGWPAPTPTRPASVFSSRFAPLVDDLDGDGLVELILISDGRDVLVWDFDAPFQDGDNRARFLYNNVNNGVWLPSTLIPTGVEEDPRALPDKFELSQNYPNPFNPSTNIEFTLPRRASVTLTVFNILGQQVVELLNDDLAAGRHEIKWDADNHASGVYLYRLRTDDFTATRKMVMLK